MLLYTKLRKKTENWYICKNRSMLTKKKLILALRDLPEKFSIEDVIDRIVLLQKIEIGPEQLKTDKTKTISEAKTELKKWLSSKGIY